MNKRKPLSKFKRPFLTRYYDDVTTDPSAWASQGASKTESGAIRAAVPRVFERQRALALVIARDSGIVLRSLMWDGKNLTVHHGNAPQLNAMRSLQRVK